MASNNFQKQRPALLRRYREDRNGLITTEFAIISLALLLIVFFIVELTLLYSFIQTEQKAAQMGARLAIVSDPAVIGLPSSHALAGGHIFGTPCSTGSCISYGTLTCEGANLTSCSPAFTDRILPRMQSLMPGLLPEHVTITYSYSGLGYAGGPIIPAVTVSIAGIPHQTGILGALLGGNNALSTLPPVTVSVTGEDLSTTGA